MSNTHPECRRARLFDAAKAQVAEAEANNAKAQSDLIPLQALIDKQEISQQQCDVAVARQSPALPTTAFCRGGCGCQSNMQSKQAQAEADLLARAAPETMRGRARASRKQADRKGPTSVSRTESRYEDPRADYGSHQPHG